jgi:hypothetical protein
LANKSLFLTIVCLVLVAPAWSGHTLTTQEQKVLKDWLGQHKQYRRATDQDCDCASDIENMKTGYGGKVKPIPDYHSYVATGDFNGDGVRDFAVVVIDPSKQEKNFALVVFNGPFDSGTTSPAFMRLGLDLKYSGLSYGPPRPKPYRLLLGPFESDSGVLLIPRGRTYRLD